MTKHEPMSWEEREKRLRELTKNDGNPKAKEAFTKAIKRASQSSPKPRKT